MLIFLEIYQTKSTLISQLYKEVRSGQFSFFAIFDDFWTAMSLFSVLFADDTTCLAKGFNLRELTAFVNEEMRKISNWFRSNKMALNTSKTKLMIFRTHGKQINEQYCHLVYHSTETGQISDPQLVTPLDRVHNTGTEKSFKLLGMYFDEYLSFDSHIEHLCKKVSKTLLSLKKEN